MKKIVTVIALLCSFASHAQFKNTLIYGHIGGGKGSFNSINFGLNFVKNNTVFSVGYLSLYKGMEDLPSYYDGYGWGPIVADPPNQVMAGITLEAGKMFTFGQSRSRFALKGGLFIGKYTYPDNIRRSYGGFFESPYTWDIVSQESFGFIIHPTYELAAFRHAGLSFGTRININSAKSSLDFDVNLLLGKVCNRRVVSKN